MIRRRAKSVFESVRVEGGLFPQDFLERLVAGDAKIPGLTLESYHLEPQDRLNEAVNRSWSRLQGTWRTFQDQLAKLPESDTATSLTRERWLLPLFQELGYGRLLASKGLEVEGKPYAITHFWNRSPVHLLGCRVPLDHRTKGIAGAATSSPHSLVQEFLNRSDKSLWGILTSGYALRLLRDHHSLARQAHLEFDLHAIMEGDLFSEFLLLWVLCHQSRIEAEKPEECWLETWFKESRQEGVRALDQLRGGVQESIEHLGGGFLRQSGSVRLQRGLSDGSLDKQEYYRQLLRLVYRLIFLFVAEEREALLDPQATQEARDRFTLFYSTSRIRLLAEKVRGDRNADLWAGLRPLMHGLDKGSPELGLPALGSFLWSEDALPWLMDAVIANEDLLAAVRCLCHITEEGVRRPVNWRNTGSEELGSVYEALLELHPVMNREAGTFELQSAPGHERKTTGSYYTPTPLVDCILDSALDPILDEATKKREPEQALLGIKVCDPACGSGHFLVAAARRIARRLARMRSGDEEPSPQAVRHALRDVAGRCLFGVDLNPMAVELCKVSLWMEAVEPGRPLSFLDAHIQQVSMIGPSAPLMIGA